MKKLFKNRLLHYWITATTDGWYGFHYARITGNNHKRHLLFLGLIALEIIDTKEYPGIKDSYYATWRD